ncbi:RDD family protein [Rhodococcus sp. NPDC058639]|uniref:RDD family protein n=1 Tax=Rhodococcus sp. NPDC058639 TaxID=3346570 RepID=UPI00364A658D
MTTGGYPPPSQDPRKHSGYPGAPSHGDQPYGNQPADYTQQFQNPIQSGYNPNDPSQGGQYGAPQYGAPQYGQQPGAQQHGAGATQYGAPQQGGPQYGAPQYGAPQQGGPQYGAPQYGAPQNEPYGATQYGAPGFPPAPGAGFGPTRPGELLPRLGARIIDALIVGIPMAILTSIVVFGSDSGFMAFVMSVLSGVAAFAYWTYFESTKGATIGKKLLGLSVVGPGGGLPTREQAAKRNAFVALQILSGIPFLGWLVSLASFAAWIGIAVTIEQDSGKQGFHDKFAGGTRVVKS